MSTRKIDVEILQVLDQILQGLALRPVIRVFLEIAKPPVAFLPVDILKPSAWGTSRNISTGNADD